MIDVYKRQIWDQTNKSIFLFSRQSDSKHIGLIMNLIQYLLYFSFAFGRHVATIVQHPIPVSYTHLNKGILVGKDVQLLALKRNTPSELYVFE